MEYRESNCSWGAGIGAEKRFFHWDLEYPEAFVDLETWDVETSKDDQGFDAVVGNPPYDELSEHASGRDLPERGLLQRTAALLQMPQVADSMCSGCSYPSL